jgi:hypothetical protein
VVGKFLTFYVTTPNLSRFILCQTAINNNLLRAENIGKETLLQNNLFCTRQLFNFGIKIVRAKIRPEMQRVPTLGNQLRGLFVYELCQAWGKYGEYRTYKNLITLITNAIRF